MQRDLVSCGTATVRLFERTRASFAMHACERVVSVPLHRVHAQLSLLSHDDACRNMLIAVAVAAAVANMV